MNVLIFSAATGGGHFRASNALESYIKNHRPDCNVCVVDAFKEVNIAFDKVVCDGYHFVATKTPKLFGRMYTKTDDKSLLSKFVPKVNAMCGQKLMPIILEFAPDVIVATHPFIVEMLSYMKVQGRLYTPVIALLTDYAPHKTWIAPKIEQYVVSNDDMKEAMVHDFGVDAACIHPVGIPVFESFFQTPPKNAVRKSIKLDPDKKTVLLMGGSFGVSNLTKIYKTMCDMPVDFQMIVITGRNTKMYKALEPLVRKSAKKTVLVQFTKEVETYMHASDMIITKPGGLTISEALATNLPLATFDAIPGQEEMNAEFLVKHNMARRLQKKDQNLTIVREMLEDETMFAEMKQACESFDKKDACKEIIEMIESLIK